MNIGLIAMSGIRAQNQELMQLGLTLPGFVERSKVIASLPSLSLLTLAGLTPAKYNVEYREIADLKQFPELPDHYDLVAITSLSAQIYDAYQVADTYRAKNIPVLMGGLARDFRSRRSKGALHQCGRRRRRIPLAAGARRL